MSLNKTRPLLAHLVKAIFKLAFKLQKTLQKVMPSPSLLSSLDLQGAVGFSWRDDLGSVQPLNAIKIDNRYQATAPSVDKDETIILQVTVQDEQGSSAKQTLALKVTNSDTSQDTAPIVSITPASITINEGTNGTLIGSAQAQNQKSIQRVQWEALASNSLVISIDGASDGNTVNFTAPQVDQDQELQLRFTATDSAGESRSAIANVLVKNVLANQLPQARAGIINASHHRARLALMAATHLTQMAR